MFRVTLEQLRHSLPRLVAAGIAIVIGTAFVALTMLAGNAMQQASRTAMSAQYAQADLVLRSNADQQLTLDEVAALQAVDGVTSVDPMLESWQNFATPERNIVQIAVAMPADQAHNPFALTDGSWPTQAGQIALDATNAELFGVGIGDEITLAAGSETPAPDQHLTVVGIISDPNGAYLQSVGAVLMSRADLEMLRTAGDAATQLTGALISTDGVPEQAVRDQIVTATAQRTGIAPDALELRTTTEIADARAASAMGGENLAVLFFGLTFAAIALLVAGLVIANTFSVLIAQRTRTLALLRCVGADRGQIRRSVLLEALGLGLAASVVGTALGTALAQVGLQLAAHANLALPLPTVVQPTPLALGLPILVGTVVTTLAALVPARAATRVAPLAALQPLDAPSVAKRAGRLRLALASLMVVGGAAAVWGGVQLANPNSWLTGRIDRTVDLNVALLIAIAGVSISFVGVLISAVFWLPSVAGLAGRLVGLSGPTARLAAANTLRNPRRTAATATALLIGVTLVSTVSTGAASAQSTLNHILDTNFPMDVLINQVDTGTSGGLSLGLRDELAATNGVGAVVPVAEAPVWVTMPGAADPQEIGVKAVDSTALDDVVRNPDLLAALAPGTVVVPRQTALASSVADGDQLTLTGPDGTLTVKVALSDMFDQALFLDTADLTNLDANAPTTGLWLGLANPLDAANVLPRIQRVAADAPDTVFIQGWGAERATYERFIGTALNVVIGLLAASVVIALIGVANTLSLSVIERQRESATLRAIGLSGRRLRQMLAIEGMLIASVGAVLGLVIGVIYGWAGATTLLAQVGDVVLTLPWPQIWAALAIALAAGALASILPGRTAAKAAPVAALAAD